MIFHIGYSVIVIRQSPNFGRRRISEDWIDVLFDPFSICLFDLLGA